MDKQEVDSILASNSGASPTAIAIAKIWLEGYEAGEKAQDEKSREWRK